jgi:hypothetical protein
MIDEENDSECGGARQAREGMSEAEIDYNVRGSFPASDPPSWTLGVRPRKTSRDEFEERSPRCTTRHTRTNHPTHDAM